MSINANYLIYFRASVCRERREKIDDIKKNIRDALLVGYLIVVSEVCTFQPYKVASSCNVSYV